MFLSADLWSLMAKHWGRNTETETRQYSFWKDSDSSKASITVISRQQHSRYVCLFKPQLSFLPACKCVLHHLSAVSQQCSELLYSEKCGETTTYENLTVKKVFF